MGRITALSTPWWPMERTMWQKMTLSHFVPRGSRWKHGSSMSQCWLLTSCMNWNKLTLLLRINSFPCMGNIFIPFKNPHSVKCTPASEGRLILMWVFGEWMWWSLLASAGITLMTDAACNTRLEIVSSEHRDMGSEVLLRLSPALSDDQWLMVKKSRFMVQLSMVSIRTMLRVSSSWYGKVIRYN